MSKHLFTILCALSAIVILPNLAAAQFDNPYATGYNVNSVGRAWDDNVLEINSPDTVTAVLFDLTITGEGVAQTLENVSTPFSLPIKSVNFTASARVKNSEGWIMFALYNQNHGWEPLCISPTNKPYVEVNGLKVMCGSN